MSDIVERLNVIAEADVHETWRDGTLDKHDLLKWEGIMIEAAAEITRLRAALDAERVWVASDPTAQTEPLTAGQRIVAWWETTTASEPCDLAQKIDRALDAERERCAKVADMHGAWTRSFGAEKACEMVAAAIRDLPPPEAP